MRDTFVLMYAMAESGGVATGLIGIILTLIGLAVSIHHFSSSYRAAAKVKMIDWISKLADDFHKDEGYVRVRLLLAKERVRVRRQLILEYIYDGMTVDSLARERLLTVADESHFRSQRFAGPEDVMSKLDWSMLKDVTDYLYFFERLLIQGESLASQKFKGDALLMVDHFGWFMRSLLCHWTGPQSGAPGDLEDRWRARKFFIHYLAENRYRRLAQVALLLVSETREEELRSMGEADASKYRDMSREYLDAIVQLLKSGQGKHGHSDFHSLADLRAKWSPMLAVSGASHH
jgi:hypothetical protein